MKIIFKEDPPPSLGWIVIISIIAAIILTECVR